MNSKCFPCFVLFWLLSFAFLQDDVRGQRQEAPPPRPAARSSPAPDPVAFDQLNRQAEQAREKGELAAAIQIYHQLVKMRPNWAEGWWYLGSLNYDADQYAAGASAFEKLLVLDPQNSQAWGLLGLCEYQLKKNTQALKHLTKSRQLGLDRIPEISRVVRLHQAILLNRSRQFEAALFVLNTFAVENKEANTVLDAMGMAVLRISEPLESLYPEQREMIRQFGQAAYLDAQQKRQESFQLYGELEARYRGRPNVAYAYGAALLVQREPEKALAYFKQELAREPNHEAALLQMALQLIVMGKFEEGIPYAQKAITVAPGNFAGYYALGRIYLYCDKAPQSLPVLEKAVNLAPTVATLHYTLSQAYQRVKRPADAARARAEFERLTALNKDRRGDLFISSGEPASPQPTQPSQPQNR